MKNFLKIVFFGLAVALAVKFWPRVEKKMEKVLNMAVPAQIDNLDPAVTQSKYAMDLFGKVYEGLLEYHYLKRPFELIPNLAEAMPTVSEDGLTYTFKIKQGVYFHDNPCFPNGKGRELVAEDFVYSFKRIADSAVQSPYFSALQDPIKGLDAFRHHLTAHKGDYDFAIEGMQALDNYTLQFTLNKKFPLLLKYLATSYTSVVAKEAVDYYGDSFMNHPVGTGPFILEKFNSQDSKVILFKNPTFRDKFYPTDSSSELQHLLAAAGKKLPFVDKVVCNILTEETPRWLQFMDKKLDVLAVESACIPKVFENKKLSKSLKAAGISLFSEIKAGIGYIGFNCFMKPLDNLKLRQAMSLAFDREGYNKLFEDNLAVIPHSFIPPCFTGYSEQYINPYATYDIAKAKVLLAAAGYPDGKELPIFTLAFSAHTTRKLQAEFFAKCMKKIGITIAIDPSPFPELCNKVHKGKFMLSMLSMGADIADAIDLLKALRNPGEAGFKIVDPEFNRLYDQAILMEETAEKAVVYEKLNAMATELIPALFRPIIPQCVITHARVKNYCISDFHHNIELYLDVEGE